jgi:signal transduction histidine kinase
MKRSRKWIWTLLFILMVLLIGGLAAGWNVVLVQDYQKFIELTRKFQLPSPQREDLQHPWLGITLGSLGFLAALVGSAVFFVRLLREMRLNQIQSDFLASVSHSLKTPLSTLELSSQLLRQGDLSEAQREQLWNSHAAELRRLKSDVNAILEAARLTHAPETVSIQSLEIEAWIEQHRSRWRDILGPHGTLTRSGPPLKVRASVDPKLLEMIFENLIENARKFAIGSPHVNIDSQIDSQRWSITLKDSGLGFDPADSDKIFDRFYRSKNSGARTIPGTGLGLYLAAQGAKTLGLTLTARSHGVGRGASFRLTGTSHP